MVILEDPAAVAAEVVVLVLVEQEILLQQLLLKEIQVVINFTRDQVMVVEAAVVTLQQVLMVHQVPEVLVEQEQILVQHMETLAQHVQYSVVVEVVDLTLARELKELLEQAAGDVEAAVEKCGDLGGRRWSDATARFSEGRARAARADAR